MQIRSFDGEIQPVPIALDLDFPMTGGEFDIQTDRPITYLHVHDCLELGYCFSGSGIFVVGEKVMSYEAGDVSFINSTEIHLAASTPGTQSDWSWIYLDPMRLVSHPGVGIEELDPTPLAGPGFPNILSAREHPAISRVVRRMIEELREREPGAQSALRALTWELMVLLRRLVPALQTFSPRGDYERLAPALQLLARDYATPLSVGRLARLCGLSEPHFRRLFTRTIGRSPCVYWNALRLRMAASMLRGTGRSVLEISQDVGFETLSSFNRQFRAHYGESPRTWRASKNPQGTSF